MAEGWLTSVGNVAVFNPRDREEVSKDNVEIQAKNTVSEESPWFFLPFPTFKGIGLDSSSILCDCC